MTLLCSDMLSQVAWLPSVISYLFHPPPYFFKFFASSVTNRFIYMALCLHLGYQTGKLIFCASKLALCCNYPPHAFSASAEHCNKAVFPWSFRKKLNETVLFCGEGGKVHFHGCSLAHRLLHCFPSIGTYAFAPLPQFIGHFIFCFLFYLKVWSCGMGWCVIELQHTHTAFKIEQGVWSAAMEKVCRAFRCGRSTVNSHASNTGRENPPSW